MFTLLLVLSLYTTPALFAAAAAPENSVKKNLAIKSVSLEKAFTTHPRECPIEQNREFGIALYYTQQLLTEKDSESKEVSTERKPIILLEVLARLQDIALAGFFDAIIIYAGLILANPKITEEIIEIDGSCNAAAVQAVALLGRVIAGGHFPVLDENISAIRSASSESKIIVPEAIKKRLLTEVDRAFHRQKGKLIHPRHATRKTKDDSTGGYCVVM